MATNNNSVSFLEKAASAQILLYLFFNQQGVNRSELLKNIDAAMDTIDHTIDYLKINELVSETKVKGFPPQRIFTLTAKGLKVAQPLAVIAEAMKPPKDSTHTPPP